MPRSILLLIKNCVSGIHSIGSNLGFTLLTVWSDFPSHLSTSLTALWLAGPWHSPEGCGENFPPPLVSWSSHQLGEVRVCSSWSQFLGHQVTTKGIRPLLERVAAIQDHPKPATVKQLQAFLRVVNFYHCFVLTMGQILEPLADSLKCDLKADYTHAMP